MTVLQEQGAAAKLAAAKMALADTETKNKALLAIADALLAHQDEWLEANLDAMDPRPAVPFDAGEGDEEPVEDEEEAED